MRLASGWALAAAFLAGCILPVSTGAPLPATTVGKGRVGVALSAEAPTLDLIADNGDENETGSPSAVSYGAAPAAAATMTFSFGLGDNTDLEVAGEGALYFFIFPLPTGGSIGLRQHIDAGDSLDLGLAAKAGYVSSDAEVTTSAGSSESLASATYVALQAVLQSKRGVVRPLAAINILPARIHRDPSDEGPFNFRGVASSLTLGAMFVGRAVTVGPYLAVTNFYSDRFDNSGWFFSGGLILAVRPDRNRAPDPAPAYAPTPTYGPAPGYPNAPPPTYGPTPGYPNAPQPYAPPPSQPPPPSAPPPTP